MRIQNIIDELRGEKIDIVLWSEDIREFVKNALNPAEVLDVKIVDGEEENTKIAKVLVAENQLSLAIGKKGQNSRLAARLCGVKIDIHTEPFEIEETEYELGEESAFHNLTENDLEETENLDEIQISDETDEDYEEESAFAGLNRTEEDY